MAGKLKSSGKPHWRMVVTYRVDKVGRKAAYISRSASLVETFAKIENGPSFDCIVEIKMTYVNGRLPGLSLDEAVAIENKIEERA